MTYKESIPFYIIGIYPIALILGTLISEILNLLLIILFIFDYKKNKSSIYKDPIIYFLLIIYSYLIINLFISSDFQLSLNRSIFFIRYPLLILSISYFLIKNPEKEELIFQLWMMTLIITVVDLYIQFFFGENILGFKSPWEERLSGFFNHELKVAHLLIGFFLPTFAFFLKKSPKNYYLYVILILYFIILILTNERANIIRGTLALLLFFLFIPIYKIKFRIIFLFLIIGIFISLLFFVEPIKQRFINEIKNMNINGSNKNIFFNYVKYSNYGPHFLTSIEIYKENKIFGTGIKTFRNVCNDVSIEKFYINDIIKAKSKCSTHPHQYYFEILSDLGLVGLVLFISFFLYLMYRVINSFYYSKNLILLSSGSFFIVQIIPFLPTGSFFTSFGSTIFFINIALIFTSLKKS